MKFDILESNNKQSSMRFVFILTAICVFLFMISLCLYIVISAIKGNQINDFAGISLVITSLAAMITGMGWNKVQQKKVEQ